MEYTNNISTGNSIVDQVGTLNLTGNIIPESWYHTIVNENGKPNTVAILILADIVYWYRPTEVRDETTLSVTYTKKFYDSDYLQRNYEQLMKKFNLSKKQARDALIFLENLGLVKRHFKNIVVAGLPLSNVMYIELDPVELRNRTYPPQNNDDNKKVTTPLPEGDYGITKIESPSSTKINTYTETTTKTNTKNTTSTYANSTGCITEEQKSVVAKARDLFSEFGLSDKDILSIVSASGFDIERCRNAKNVLNAQCSDIKNVVGWLIKAVRENYQALAKVSAKRNSIHGFQERTYTDEYWEELKKRVYAN